MSLPARSFCLGALAAILASTGAQAQEACSTHVVAAGDNLRSIARNALGDAGLYRLIYEANAARIGAKADLILVGTVLVIPCDKDGTLPVDAADAGQGEAGQGEAGQDEAGQDEAGQGEVAASGEDAAQDLAPTSIPLTTEVIDPAKQPVEMVPELPFVIVGAPVTEAEPLAEAEPVAEPAAEPVEVAAEDPLAEAAPPQVTETAPAPETGTEAESEASVEPLTEAEPLPEVAAAEPPVAEVVADPVPEAVAEAPAEIVVAASEPVATAPAARDAEPIRLLTGNDYAPFADEMLPGGGMITQLVEMAVFRADPAIHYNLTFINDWQAHIDALLPMQAYDLSFPWIRPDCEAPQTLSAGDLSRCENFEFSAPLYEIVDGYFAKADSALVLATDYAAFEGTRICRPEGYTTGVLDAVGLSAPKVELLRPVSALDCFEALEAGDVDLVSIDAEVGDSAIAELGLVGMFAQNPHLTTFLSLHVIAHKSNPRAVAMVQQLNVGIVEMYDSGEWYDIVSSALTRGALQQ